ncbi:M24 family metallopeptidase, partial [candidate division KSB1 bacterium]|nr:M24 family metallopeptidase [candidate division KSB1 bacterium]
MSFVKFNRFLLFILFISANTIPSLAQPKMPVVLPLKERAKVINRWLQVRLKTVLPELMRREGIDMWIVIAREYNEDPVIKTMLPANWMAARRRTILLMYDSGKEGDVERLAVARYDIGEFFKRAWDKEKQPDQWKRLAEIIVDKNPKKIAINWSNTFALADGISHAEFESFTRAIPDKYKKRIVPGENLAIGWLETRTPEEMQVYPMVCKIAHEIIVEGLSERVIQPGVTSTDDVEWWYRERIAGLKLQTWFHPSVSIQRAGEPEKRGSFASRPDSDIILPGDLLHIDFGITYLRLNTDTQQHAYVLKPGEKEAPAGLRKALKTGNRLQDILTANFKKGRTGNEILSKSLEQAKAEGIKPSIYTHPIGFHRHPAGPTIGMWDQQGG